MENRFIQYLDGIQRIISDSGARIAYKDERIEYDGIIWRGDKSVVVVNNLKEAEALQRKLKKWVRQFKADDTDKPYRFVCGIGYAEGKCEIMTYPIPVTMKDMSKNDIKKYVLGAYAAYNKGRKEEDMEDPAEDLSEVEKTLSYEETYKVSFYKNSGMAYKISYFDPIEGRRVRDNVGDVFILYNETAPDSIQVSKIQRQRKRRSNAIDVMADYKLSLSPTNMYYIRIIR